MTQAIDLTTANDYELQLYAALTDEGSTESRDGAPVIAGLEYPVELNMYGIPQMPAALAKFQQPLDDAAIEALAQEAFDAWENNPGHVLKNNIYRFSACHNSGVEFGVDPVSPRDYAYQSADLSDPEYFAYAYDEAVTDIRMAVAKRVCGGCPVRAMCLSASMNEYRNGKQVMEESGVWGGVGSTGREAVFGAYVRKLDEYDAAHAEDGE